MIPGAGNREARDEEVLLSQPLDLFGRRRALARVAAAELRRQTAESTGAERALVVAVKNAAFDLYAAQEAEALADVQAEVAGIFRTAAARRAELGDVPAVQVQRAELEVLRAANELSKTRSERLARLAALNLLIGAAPQTPLRVALPEFLAQSQQLRARPAAFGQAESMPPAEPLKAAAPTAIDIGLWREQLLPQALRERSDIVAAEATVQARRAQADAVRRERLPGVELQARRSSFFGREGSYAFRAAISLPLFDFGSLKGERRAAEAEAQAGEAALAQLRSQAATQIEQALLRLEQNRRSVESFRSGILPISIDLLRKTQIGYAQGASSYLEVLDAQRTLRQVQVEYLQALIAGKTGEAALETALGAPLVVPQTKDRP
jgi:cobalt-zinc-cadmium efflux system outer membrane protein